MADPQQGTELLSPSPSPSAPPDFGGVLQIPIIIPCHRVIRSSGDSGHYGGGQLLKEWLLSHEKLQRQKVAQGGGRCWRTQGLLRAPSRARQNGEYRSDTQI